MDQLIDQSADNDLPLPWLWRVLIRFEAWARPFGGWSVLIGCMLLAMLPAVALRANRWLALDNYQTTLELTGPLAVGMVWAVWGWRAHQRNHFGWQAVVLATVGGALLLSQLLLGWLPGPRLLVQVAVSGDWARIPAESIGAWMRAGTRFVLWREGVLSGGAAQDNLIFAIFGATVLWLVGMLTAWLARRTRQGFAAGVPSLWLLGLILLYSNGGRYLLLTGLLLMLALHILLEQGTLNRRWQQLGLDFSPGLLVDRFLTVLGAAALILTLAAIMPNLYIRPLVDSYYALLAPVHLALEATGERLFPELRGTSRVRGGSGSGMPNEFLLRGGPNLGNAAVMRVRTDEAAAYAFPFDEMIAPPGHYMRGRTLTVYDGRGWSNVGGVGHEEVVANRRWDGAAEWGRKQVVQSVILETNSSILFAAPEPVEASADVRLEQRGADDLVAVQAREASYTVVSMVPAVDEVMLRGLPTWEVTGNGVPLPDAMAVHLVVPDSVTERTRELAQEVVAGQATAYDQAVAIEQYLRQYTYDLDVPEPPDDVTDMADYFLFELQRGYCDYYATAFIVLARLAGLPARFATGYSTGQWIPNEGVFLISESDAHSWPEVYFPEVGWIPFEPTAGRAQLARVAVPQANNAVVPPPIVAASPGEEDVSETNWQPLLWLGVVGVVGGLVVLGWQWWWRRREDPWQAILQWGKQNGRPMHEGETVLEYGQELADFVMVRQRTVQDTGRIAAREIQAVSEAVNSLRYAPENERTSARSLLEAHWTRLREYLRLVRVA